MNRSEFLTLRAKNHLHYWKTCEQLPRDFYDSEFSGRWVAVNPFDKFGSHMLVPHQVDRAFRFLYKES
ncbi:MAG: hypothetical protein CMK32_07905 [Porticoccaceae bacterium]|nr:hypothetical protein [Porticoccaceae bacterium]